MGTTQSTQSAVNDIRKLHSEVDGLVFRIKDEGNKAVQAIVDSKFDSDELCDRLSYQYTEVLSNFFPVETLDNARIKLGLELPAAKQGALNNKKEQICKAIVNFYRYKISIIRRLQQAVPNCQQRERAIFDTLSTQMQQTNNLDEKWSVVYKNLKSFNANIKSKYAAIRNLIKEIYYAPTQAKLVYLEREAIKLINDTNETCDLGEASLPNVREMQPTRRRPAEPVAPVNEPELATEADDYPVKFLINSRGIKAGTDATFLREVSNNESLIRLSNGVEVTVPNDAFE